MTNRASTLALIGMALLSRVSVDTAYLTGVALPMMLMASARVSLSAP